VGLSRRREGRLLSGHISLGDRGDRAGLREEKKSSRKRRKRRKKGCPGKISILYPRTTKKGRQKTFSEERGERTPTVHGRGRDG